MISIPFHGSKKTSYKYVKPIVENYGYRSVYEPFGGSGILSLNLYKDGLVDRVRINDYDMFFDDYEKYLDYKDWIVENCLRRGMVKTNSCAQYGVYKRINGQVVQLESALLDEDDKQFLQNLVKQVPYKYWRYLALGHNFTFPGVAQHDVIKLSDFVYFSSYIKTDKQREYLKWIDKVDLDHLDYRAFLKKYKSEMGRDSLLIIDPPYIDKYQGAYKGRFNYDDTRELIEVLKDLKVDFIFFSEDKDTVNEFLDGLNIVDNSDIATGKKANLHSKNRIEHFAFVRFDRKRDYKKETFNPVITGLASRSPTYTLKDGFVDKGV